MKRVLVRVARLLAKALMGLSVLTLLGVVWLACGWPVGLDRWLDVSTTPVPSAVIVCLGGGTTSTKLPLPNGWDRIDTSSQLFADGLAPAVVFSGGGTGAVSETQIYANAAVWLGVPRASIAFEPLAQDTAGHARALVGLALPNGQRIERDTPILIVTSAFHSRRALMTFRRAGFSNVRVVSHYAAKTRVPGTPAAMTNTVAAYHPSGKSYDDVLFRLAYRSFDFLIDLREMAALGWYWWQGKV